jgi:hypothetical protein
VKIRLYVLEIDELSPRTKRLLLSGGILAVMAGTSALVHAGLPQQFQDNQVLSATGLNANFTALDSRLDRLEAVSPDATGAATGAPVRWIVTRGGLSYSMGALICGITAPTLGAIMAGPFVSWQSAKNQCESSCGSKSAHMCSADEATRTAQMFGDTRGLPYLHGQMGAGWIASAANGQGATDCAGWTTSSGPTGTYWGGIDTAPVACTTPNSILCCD